MLQNYASLFSALKTMDELVQKIEFDGPSLSITSKNLAVGISALNTSNFNGTSFSAFIPPNGTDPQVPLFMSRVKLAENQGAFIMAALDYFDVIPSLKIL